MAYHVSREAMLQALRDVPGACWLLPYARMWSGSLYVWHDSEGQPHRVLQAEGMGELSDLQNVPRQDNAPHGTHKEKSTPPPQKKKNQNNEETKKQSQRACARVKRQLSQIAGAPFRSTSEPAFGCKPTGSRRSAAPAKAELLSQRPP